MTNKISPDIKDDNKLALVSRIKRKNKKNKMPNKKNIVTFKPNLSMETINRKHKRKTTIIASPEEEESINQELESKHSPGAGI